MTDYSARTVHGFVITYAELIALLAVGKDVAAVTAEIGRRDAA